MKTTHHLKAVLVSVLVTVSFSAAYARDPEPINRILGELGAVSNRLGAAEDKLNMIAIDPGPIGDPAVLAALQMIVAQSDGITDRAVQLEQDPGPISDPAVLAALDGIVDQATMISAIANSLLSCALSGCP